MVLWFQIPNLITLQNSGLTNRAVYLSPPTTLLGDTSNCIPGYNCMTGDPSHIYSTPLCPAGTGSSASRCTDISPQSFLTSSLLTPVPTPQRILLSLPVKEFLCHNLHQKELEGGTRHKTKFSAPRFICPRETEAGNKGQRQEIEERVEGNKGKGSGIVIPQGQRTTCGETGDRCGPLESGSFVEVKREIPC